VALVSSAPFRAFAIVIDKVQHWQKTYRSLQHPYHYCMQAMLERYCGWLEYRSLRGDVMAEARGKTENRALEAAYTDVHQYGTSYMAPSTAQNTLTTKQVKIVGKDRNVAGLQLADLLAQPLTRDVLLSFRRVPSRGGAFADTVARLVLHKYNLNEYRGIVQGYGRVLLT
jgi:hypothetical protein